MTEENKYYVPEPNEFCIGFEFEVNSMALPPSETTQREVWIPKTWGDEFFSLIGREHTIKLWARCKYLSKEDIEACGWKKDTGDYCFMKDGYTLEVTEEYADLKFEILFQGVGSIKTLFAGTIKNRSELQRIMKMVGI